MLAGALRRLSLRPSTSSVALVRFKQTQREEFARDLWERRQLLGPDDPIHPNRFPNWDRGVELSALSARIRHRWQDPSLLPTLFHPDDQEELRVRGQRLIRDTMAAWLRGQFPKLPEEGIAILTDCLGSEELAAEVGRHLGLDELVDADHWPVSADLTAATFQALVGALSVDGASEAGSSEPSPALRLLMLVLAPQLHGKDIAHLVAPKDPMGLLCHVLSASGRELPEPRLLRQTGSETILGVHVVGLYSSRELLGQSAGETVEMAEEMAARDALRSLWGLEESREALVFDPAQLELSAAAGRRNESVGQWEWLDPWRENGLEESVVDVQEAHERFKEDVEPDVGVPRRMRQRHTFSRGTRNRRNFRRLNRPFVWNIT